MSTKATSSGPDGLNCPSPRDCGDLAETFRIDMAAVFHRLMTLTTTQINLRMQAYATYLNQLHGLDLDIDDVLANWQRRIKRMQHIA